MKRPVENLDDLSFFVAVVDTGGFSSAARAMGARKAQVSRRVQELERSLGLRLLEDEARHFADTAEEPPGELPYGFTI